MNALGRFIMRGRMTASLVIACCVILEPLFPPLVLLSGGALALVTLRAGTREGLLVMIIAGLGGSAIALFALGSVQLVYVFSVLFWMPLFVFAAVLRATVSLSLVLRLLAGLGLILVLGVYAVLGNPADVWAQVLSDIAPPAAQLMEMMGAQVTQEMVEQQISSFAPKFTGIVVSWGIAQIALSLLIGRWWQGLLYNPGGFGEEFRQLKMGQPFAIGVLALVGLAIIADVEFLSNVALGISVVVALFGLAVIHGAVSRAKAGRGWLVCVYALLVLLQYPMFMFLALIGAADTWLDLRAKVAARTGGG